MKQVILVILVLSLGLSVVFAQGRHKGHKHHHPKLNKEARAALHEFHKETIYPVKKAAHDQLLATLSKEDQAFLAQKRVEGKALHQEMRSMHQEMKELRASGKTREEIHAIRKAKFAPLKEKRGAFMESMKPFMERNKALIQTAMEPMKEKHDAWKTKKEAIIAQYLSTEEQAKMETCKKERGERGHRGRHHGHHGEKGGQEAEGGHHGHHGHHGEKGAHGAEGGKGRGKGAVRFVLWDGEMKTPKGNEKDNGVERTTTAIENLPEARIFTVNTYPNPAISQTTILLDLTEESKKVKVSLSNAKGQQVWFKTYNKLTKGEHKIDVNLQKLDSGQYFCTVEIGAERISKPLVVNK
ncbi:MAG: Unknown protein [uncultured Aureispira sp.]|uniref:Secretion system C-terminal sorting domain-containing protein n=1 Tax=uncultured Aureispira sp. TaxID=1331704 RepID=A0A6S6S0V3_9BACT|nr:MAG: Unknown protein [uncultured Aureispira sp.]